VSNTPYTPQIGSLAYRICAWFQSNRDEELSRADIAKKFEIAAASIDGLLSACFTASYLNRAKDDDGGAIIVAGSKLKDLVLSAAPPPVAAGKKRKLGQRLPPLSLSSLKVEKGVPIPPRRIMEKGRTRYDEIFDALEPDTSIEVPAHYVPAMLKAAQTFGKRTNRKFIVRKVTLTAARVWRTE
jgi:hypothetical protein